MNKYIYAVAIICFSNYCNAQNYYGVDGFGKLTLTKDNKYHLHYFDTGLEEGSFRIYGDTLYLKSDYLPIQLVEMPLDSFYEPKGYNIPFKVYNEDCLILDTIAIYDTINNMAFIDVSIEKGLVLAFEMIPFTYKIMLDTSIKGSQWVRLAKGLNRKIFFDNFPLLIFKDCLIPIDSSKKTVFRRINNLDISPMCKGRRNKKYKVYLSGFSSL